MSGDHEQEYFSDGITDDLITDLSRLPGLFVIARDSVFTCNRGLVRQRKSRTLRTRNRCGASRRLERNVLHDQDRRDDDGQTAHRERACPLQYAEDPHGLGDVLDPYKGKAAKLQDVGKELGVKYVLEGSVRKAGEQLRIMV